jgi:hypothetical protein
LSLNNEERDEHVKILIMTILVSKKKRKKEKKKKFPDTLVFPRNSPEAMVNACGKSSKHFVTNVLFERLLFVLLYGLFSRLYIN